MARYDIVLLDADMTIFDFERSEQESLRRTLAAHGLSCTDEVEATYLKINHALWEAFARGEVDQDFLVVERFAALARVYNINWDAAKVNRDYLNGLGDANSLYLDSEEYARYTSKLEGDITGIGVESALDYRTGDFVITHVYAESPA